MFGRTGLEGSNHLGGKVPDQQLQHDINDITRRGAVAAGLRRYFIFQNVIPLACCPTSTVPAIARD